MEHVVTRTYVDVDHRTARSRLAGMAELSGNGNLRSPRRLYTAARRSRASTEAVRDEDVREARVEMGSDTARRRAGPRTEASRDVDVMEAMVDGVGTREREREEIVDMEEDMTCIDFFSTDKWGHTIVS